ncbi:MAG: DUF748 domain-containing protein [bacterium]|nr:DUF748 domain-containing protein [bacterium]
MKKFLLIGGAVILILVLVVGGVGFYYWQSIAASMVKSKLESLYGLKLEYDGLSINPATRSLTMSKVRVLDIKNLDAGPLFNADSLSVWGDFGEDSTPKVLRLQTEGFHVEVKQLSGGEFPLAVVAKRLMPALDLAAALGVSPNDKADKTWFVIDFGLLDYDIDGGSVRMKNAAIRRDSANAEPFLALGALDAKNLSGGKPLTATASGLRLRGIETGPDQYDFMTPYKAYQKLAGGSGESKTPTPMGSIQLSDAIIAVAPNNGKPDSPSGVEIAFKQADFDGKNIKLQSFSLKEQGQPLVEANRADVSLSDDMSVRSIALDTPRAMVRGEGDGSNLGRAQKRLNSIAAAFSNGDKKASGAAKSAPLPAVKASNLTLNAIPADGQPSSPGAVEVTLKNLDFNGTSAEAQGLEVKEKGETLVKTIQMKAGLSADGSLNSLDLDSPQAMLREDASGLNLARAQQRLTALAGALSSDKKTASKESGALQHLIAGNIQLEYWKDGAKLNEIQLESIGLDSKTRDVSLKNLSFHPTSDSSVDLPEITGVLSAEGFSAIDTLTVQAPVVKGYFDANASQPFDSLESWLTAPTALSGDGAKKSDRPLSIRSFEIRAARVQLEDRRVSPAIEHIFDPIDLTWTNLVLSEKPPMGAIQASAAVQAPSQGTAKIDGKLAPSFSPLNMDAQIDASVSDLTAYLPYYQGALPVAITSGGLAISGKVPIKDDKIDALVDVTLKQPVLAGAGKTLPDQMKADIAIQAVNGMKDANGDIVIKQNRITGDLSDPQFEPGVTIFEVLGKNILQRVMSVPGMLTHPVETTKNLIEGAAGTAQGAVGGVMGGLKSLFGGGASQPENATQ